MTEERDTNSMDPYYKLLLGKVKCKSCGKNMTKCSARSNNKIYVYLRCSSYVRKRCTSHMISYKLLIKELKAEIKSFIIKEENIGVLQRIYDYYFNNLLENSLSQEYKKIDEEVSKIKKRLFCLNIDLVRKAITETGYYHNRKLLMEGIKKLELQKRLLEINSIKEYAEDRKNLIRNFIKDYEREEGLFIFMLENIVHKVEIAENNIMKKERYIYITYKDFEIKSSLKKG
ncbi:zinc ribbon domain-containing protein [Desnuesiella massiliensis]|uniref:zinc ribbon domain-containing protein n=1 Tax=Desnuesiella massiliensis TaxID=1650662 RepID=UPI0006E12DCC|nr:zinc ribbon domain-containing protein [Desnuesiella massiliensis]